MANEFYNHGGYPGTRSAGTSSPARAEFQAIENGFDEVEAALDNKLEQAALDAHINDPADAHDASAISNTPSGAITATTVQAVINQVAGFIAAINSAITAAIDSFNSSISSTNTNLTNHIDDIADAHNASAISYGATNVEQALDDLAELNSDLPYAVTTGTGSAYIATFDDPITSYVDGVVYVIVFHTVSLVDATLQVDGVNPPLDLKQYASDGVLVNVAAGDLIGTTFVTVAQGGTVGIVNSNTALSSVTVINSNTTFTLANALDRLFSSVGTTLTHTLPLISAFPTGGSFTIYSESATCTVQRQGANTIKNAGATVNSIVLNAGDSVEFISDGTQWRSFITVGLATVINQGKNWQDVTASRGVSGAIQTNTSVRDLEVFAHQSASFSAATVNGTSILDTVAANVTTLSFAVPAGQTYSISWETGVLVRWMELK